MADDSGELVGLLDIEIEKQPGQLCLQQVKRAAFCWEFAVRPVRWGEGIGTGLIRRAEHILRTRHQVRYMEWWSMDPGAQRWYEAYGMTCINEHWRFFVRPDKKHTQELFASVQMQSAHLTLPQGPS